MSDNLIILLVVFPLVAYLIGSIPFGVIIASARGVDLRRSGSGNVGATNVGRVLGRKWGYLCFFLDVAKGLLPTLAAGLVLRHLAGSAAADAAAGAVSAAGTTTAATTAAATGAGVAATGAGPAAAAQFPTALEQLSWLMVGFGAIAGHVFSFWLRLHGGKGVATALGVVLGIYPYFTWAGLAALAIWIAVTLVTRYVSLGSIVAAVAFGPLFVAFSWLLDGRPPLRLWPLGLFAAAMMALIVVRHRGNIRRLLAGTENKIRPKKAGA